MQEVIIVTGTLGGGGAERVFLNIANEMVTRGISVRVLVTGSRPVQSYPLSEKIIVEKITSEKKNKVLKIVDKFIRFRSYLRKHSGSTVISFFPDVSAYCTLASLGIKNRNIVSERNDPYTIPRKKYMKRIRNMAFEMADCCVFQTEDARNYFSKRVQKKGCLIDNPINVSKLPTAAPIGDREKIVLAVGRIVPQKNFLMLVKAWQKVYPTHSDYVLHVYGDKTYRDGIFAEELQKYIDENGMQNQVKLMGFSDDVYSKMNEAAIYVSSSDFEGMSNTMLEAMALGLPTIATDCPIGGARKIIRSGENGLLVPVGNEEKMAEAIALLLDNKELRNELSRNALEIRDDLSVEKICDEWIKLL